MTAAVYSPAFEQLRMEVLNRMLPGLRHQMLGKLQPIALLSQILSKKLGNGPVEHDYLQTQVDEIKLNSRLLTTATQNLFSWLAWDETVRLPADEILPECIDLLKMEAYKNHLTISHHGLSKQLLPALEARILICAGILLLADKEATEKKLEITAMEGNIRFSWNAACAGAASNNTGMLNNWDWIHGISAKCQLTPVDAGMQFNFQPA